VPAYRLVLAGDAYVPPLPSSHKTHIKAAKGFWRSFAASKLLAFQQRGFQLGTFVAWGVLFKAKKLIGISVTGKADFAFFEKKQQKNRLDT
jgi:hypothetical protein